VCQNNGKRLSAGGMNELLNNAPASYFGKFEVTSYFGMFEVGYLGKFTMVSWSPNYNGGKCVVF
jgi:hypothetical protein